MSGGDVEHAAGASLGALERGDLRDFIELPGLFLPREIGPALVPGSSLRIEARGIAPDGTPLFAILSRVVPLDRPDRWDAVVGMSRALARADTSAANRADVRLARHASATVGAPRPVASVHAGDKAQHREEHLCFKCDHYPVCGMARGLDPALLVTVSHCLAFEPTDEEDEAVVCELVDVAPLGAP